MKMALLKYFKPVNSKALGESLSLPDLYSSFNKIVPSTAIVKANEIVSKSVVGTIFVEWWKEALFEVDSCSKVSDRQTSSWIWNHGIHGISEPLTLQKTQNKECAWPSVHNWLHKKPWFAKIFPTKYIFTNNSPNINQNFALYSILAKITLVGETINYTLVFFCQTEQGSGWLCY